MTGRPKLGSGPGQGQRPLRFSDAPLVKPLISVLPFAYVDDIMHSEGLSSLPSVLGRRTRTTPTALSAHACSVDIVTSPWPLVTHWLIGQYVLGAGDINQLIS